jgi:REP element-mobilizing transposase RayT
MLMPDHVHFFARASQTADTMRAWVKMWKSVSARQILTTLHIAGPVWQKDYFDRYLRSGESYSEKWEYVKANPVRAGLVEHADQWPYCGKIHTLTF